jgi:hypothetical protein
MAKQGRFHFTLNSLAKPTPTSKQGARPMHNPKKRREIRKIKKIRILEAPRDKIDYLAQP